jgi:uncharacterized membrane protein
MAALRPFISINTLVLVIYLFFCWLMAEIVFQYIPVGTETAFLGIKQEYVHIPFYLAAFYIHVFTAILALPAGLSQFSKTLLKKYPAIHRLNGKIYVVAILVLAAPSGFFIGLFANGGVISRLSFCLLAVLWSYFTYQAYVKARAGDFKMHKAFIYRSFALTMSAITLRAWKYIIIALFHPRPMDVYMVVAWLGWVPNLLLAEYLINKKGHK